MTRMIIWMLLLGFGGPVVALTRQSSSAAGAPAEVSEGAPVVLPRARQFDITSRINGERYRIMVSTPFKADPSVAYPVIYLLDGNVYFNMATDMLTRQSLRAAAPAVAPAIVVGIGYPTDDPEVVNHRRVFDFTTAETQRERDAGDKAGGGDMFLRVIEEEVKPFVMARYSIDRTKQALYGQSIGGMLALRALFRNPTGFSTYILSSPSIFFNNRQVLEDEEAFSKRARAGELHLRILVTSAGDEQYRGADSKLLAAAAENRMVDNASELASRLATLDPKNLVVVRTIFPGEIHPTVSPASLSRGLRFAMPLSPQH